MSRDTVAQPQRTYSVAQVADIFQTTKQTVYKWLKEDEGKAVIAPEDWLKLPGSGYIRIKERAILKLQGELTEGPV